MKIPSIRNAALAMGLMLLAVLPLAAVNTETGTRVQPGADIVAFFEARGVDGQYVGRPQSEVPADQWKIMAKIVTSANFDNAYADHTAYENDYDLLNTLVSNQLYSENYGIGRPVYMSIGGIVWMVEQEG